ncbi:MAG: hypothetical protein BMS9Abin05_1837 [Rhodothermia bacterium]|nr:MAG: hypothetical protein BMS9Abin05_1837 [Rhodothermia bacterium]
MRKLLPLLLVLGVTFAGTMNVPSSDSVTVEGKIVDSKCYGMSQMNLEDDHTIMGGKKVPKCGTACATMGIPVGVLEGGEAGGKVYLIVGPAGGYAELMAQEIKIEGEEAYPGAIIPSKLWVKENNKWVKKAVPGTMM